jgi:hypothetical protein
MRTNYTPGYPKDRRSDRQRLQAAASRVADLERMAARVVARLTGAYVELQDDNNRPAMPDVRIEYHDGSTAYVEVVTDIDQAYASTYREIGRRQWLLDGSLLGRRWWVRLTGQASLKRLNHVHFDPTALQTTK